MAAHPNEVFFYSVKHDYPALADQAVVLTLKNRTTEFVGRIRAAGFQDDIVIRWVRYQISRTRRRVTLIVVQLRCRDRWMGVLVELPTYPMPQHRKEDCALWYKFQVGVFGEVCHNLSSLAQLSAIADKHAQRVLGQCYYCSDAKDEWVRHIEERLAKIPKYSK